MRSFVKLFAYISTRVKSNIESYRFMLLCRIESHRIAKSSHPWFWYCVCLHKKHTDKSYGNNINLTLSTNVDGISDDHSDAVRVIREIHRRKYCVVFQAVTKDASLPAKMNIIRWRCDVSLILTPRYKCQDLLTYFLRVCVCVCVC